MSGCGNFSRNALPIIAGTRRGPVLALNKAMRRITPILFALAAVLVGCNTHQLKQSEFKHYTGAADGDDAGASSSSESGGMDSTTGDDGGDESGTGDDGGIKFDVGPVCGNGFVEPGEQCDEGEDNGPLKPCSDECIWNAQ